MIGVPLDIYNIYTQKRFLSESGVLCIVDLVLESSENILFIENKVESSEGENQLQHYYGGLGVSELRKLRQLEEENAQLKKLLADLSLDKQMLQDVLKKKF